MVKRNIENKGDERKKKLILSTYFTHVLYIHIDTLSMSKKKRKMKKNKREYEKEKVVINNGKK